MQRSETSFSGLIDIAGSTCGAMPVGYCALRVLSKRVYCEFTQMKRIRSLLWLVALVLVWLPRVVFSDDEKLPSWVDMATSLIFFALFLAVVVEFFRIRERFFTKPNNMQSAESKLQADTNKNASGKNSN